MQDPNHKTDLDIGGRLKVARTNRRMSQRELARKSGVTNGMISQIEQNQSSPSVGSLKRILDAIPMSLSEFFSDDFDPTPRFVFRAHELRELNPYKAFPDSGASGGISLRQVGNSSLHTLQMLHERYAPGADTGETLYSHNAEEAGLLISGSIEITIGDDTFALGPGDAYLFDSRIPHRFRNIGTEECVIVSACTPPSF
ncbi:cupin domain-containing protein [Pararhodobacter sp.]|uniref:cupin domain-containing protein n=1 Tax=Pararhodobacter sp. TaxID=2127056 RepID=UPI002AFDE029|nr:cupin domain-containing protein [Pararhodobacter sp.]